MTTFTVNSGATDSAGKTLANNDTGAVQDDGMLLAAIAWTGGSASPGVTLDNSGTISTTTTRAFDTAGKFTTGSLTIDNHEGATIATSGADAIRINTTITTGTITVDNAGTIQATGLGDDANGQAIDFDKLSSTSANVHVHIINEATGLISSADADAIRPGSKATIDNHGQIISLVPPDNDGNDGVDFQANTGGVVHNYAGGLIQGSHHGVTGDHGQTVINDAGATLVGGNGSGINFDSAATVADTTFVTNRGDIFGESANLADSDGDAIDVDGLVQLDNYGNVKGLGANGTHDGGANVSEGLAIGGGVVNNFAGGLIYGLGRAIQVDDSAQGGAPAATTIYNEGVIQGDGHGPQNFAPGSDAGIVLGGREAIDILGSQADTITNKGQIIGGVFTDGGNDTFNAYTGSSVTGPVDLGDGSDTLNLTGDGTGHIGVVSNVETVNFVGGGQWTVGLDSHFHGTVNGFSNLDLIDLTGVGLAASAHLGPGNVLTLDGGAGGPVTLQFDAQQSFAGYVFQLSSDGMGGTDLALAKIITGGNGGQTLAGTPGNDVITGGNGADTVNGGDGNDSLSGGNGADTLMAGTGNDTLTGGNGPDTFAFGAVFGKDVVTDFHQGDHIVFDGAFANFAAVQDAMQQVGADTVIRMDADHMITLAGVSMASLHASDFLFH